MDRARTVVERMIAGRHDRPSLVTRIASDVGAEILQGILRPGDDLNSVDLSRRYETSRTPVREALMLLEKERLVEIPPRRRPRVVRLALKEVCEIYRVRGALMELVALDVAENASAEDFVRLKEPVDEMQHAHDAGDLEGFMWANVAFHELNTQISGNVTAKRIIDSLLLRTLPLRRLGLSQDRRMERSLADHIHILQAYERHDANLAAALIRSNHMNALDTLVRCLGRSEEPASDRIADGIAMARTTTA